MLEMCIRQIGVYQFGTIQVRTFKMCFLKGRGPQISPGQIRFFKMCTVKLSVHEIGALKAGSLQISVPELSRAELGFITTSPFKIGLIKIRSNQVCVLKVYLCEDCAGEI